ncbi:MAG: hypothetical protein R3F28_04790 [Candidatus Kapaibacterium sp.]
MRECRIMVVAELARCGGLQPAPGSVEKRSIPRQYLKHRGRGKKR